MGLARPGSLATKQDTAGARPPVPIDHQRMARLNQRFRARAEARNSESQSGPQTETGALRANAARQLQSWRDARTRRQGMEHLVAMRHAEVELNRKPEMDRLGGAKSPQSFAQRRAQQLRSWRLRVSGHGDADNGWRTARIMLEKPSRLSATGIATAASRAGAR